MYTHDAWVRNVQVQSVFTDKYRVFLPFRYKCHFLFHLAEKDVTKHLMSDKALTFHKDLLTIQECRWHS